MLNETKGNSFEYVSALVLINLNHDFTGTILYEPVHVCKPKQTKILLPNLLFLRFVSSICGLRRLNLVWLVE